MLDQTWARLVAHTLKMPISLTCAATPRTCKMEMNVPHMAVKRLFWDSNKIYRPLFRKNLAHTQLSAQCLGLWTLKLTCVSTYDSSVLIVMCFFF